LILSEREFESDDSAFVGKMHTMLGKHDALRWELTVAQINRDRVSHGFLKFNEKLIGFWLGGFERFGAFGTVLIAIIGEFCKVSMDFLMIIDELEGF
jgi:hypothetical protein